MKHTRKLSAFLLTSLLIGLLASCGGEAAVGSDTTTAAETTPEVTTDAYLDELPRDLDFGGETFTFFVRSDPPSTEYNVEEQTGEIVDDAIFNRDQTVMERLNVKFAYHGIPGNYNDRLTFAQQLTSSVMAGDGAYDVVAGYSMSLANLASAGMLYNLMDVDYLDLTNPWWSENILTQSMVNDKVFFASGDIATSLLYMMYTTFYNKEMVDEFKLENPAHIALDGKWTLDKMIAMTKNVGKDINADGAKDKNDRFGMVISDVYIDPFYFGAGLSTTEQDENGMMVLSPDFGSEKVVSLIEKLCTALHDSPDNWQSPEKEGNSFHLGNTLFYNHSFNYAANNLRDVKFDYGILPICKWDENQEDYYTIASFPYSLYGIPLDAKDPDRAAAVLEALASESYKNVTPAVFEITMKVKYSRDEESSQVYDIIRGSMVYDFGRIFNNDLGSKTYSLFRNAVRNNDRGWMSTYDSNKESLNAGLAALMEKFKD